MANLDKWASLADATGLPHLKLVTNAASDLFKLTRIIVHALAISSKVSPQDIAAVIGKPLQDALNKSKDLLNKDIKLKNHAKCVVDGLGLLQWYLQGDQFEFAKEACNQIDFFGNKVLSE